MEKSNSDMGWERVGGWGVCGEGVGVGADVTNIYCQSKTTVIMIEQEKKALITETDSNLQSSLQSDVKQSC